LVGSRLPAFWTSMGRMLLAGLPDERVIALMNDLPRKRFTPRTVVEDAELLARVQTARAQGWCLIDQELEEGLISVAAPLRDRAGRTVAALNISGQANRTSAKVMQRDLLPALLRTADTISGLLGTRRG
ncbi:IclR family transcriptional regulator domain-containing protein, partial [Azospirillum brasilense]|uniref:IclR family transcriptional regulator domain-containing protein n=1 Tax=Azospirillum brasilense TaxID=192 RepID=UPI0009CFF947